MFIEKCCNCRVEVLSYISTKYIVVVLVLLYIAFPPIYKANQNVLFCDKWNDVIESLLLSGSSVK